MLKRYYLRKFFFFFFDFSNLRYIQKEKEILLTRFISGWQDNSLLYNCRSDSCSPPQDNTPSSVDPEKFGETLSCLVEVLLFIARVTSYFIARKLLDTVYYMS